VTGQPPERAPGPPPDLGGRTPQTLIVPTDRPLFRFYTAAYDPIFFDDGLEGRLNAPDASYGVLYAAERLEGAFAETFLRSPGRTLLPKDLVRSKGLVRFRVRRPLRLLRLAGPGLARVGATAQVVHGGKPYDIPQAWSAAVKALPAAYDGIAYNARHDDEAICYALFDAVDRLVEEPDRDIDLDQNWFWELAEIYGVGLAPEV